MARQTPGPILLTPTHIQAIMIACVFVGLQLQQPAKQLAYSSDQFRRNRYIDTPGTRDGPGGRDRTLALNSMKNTRSQQNLKKNSFYI